MAFIEGHLIEFSYTSILEFLSAFIVHYACSFPSFFSLLFNTECVLSSGNYTAFSDGQSPKPSCSDSILGSKGRSCQCTSTKKVPGKALRVMFLWLGFLLYVLSSNGQVLLLPVSFVVFDFLCFSGIFHNLKFFWFFYS